MFFRGCETTFTNCLLLNLCPFAWWGSVVFCHLRPQQSLTTTTHQQVTAKEKTDKPRDGVWDRERYCDSEENNKGKKWRNDIHNTYIYSNPMKSLFGHAEREEGGMRKGRDGDRQGWRKRRGRAREMATVEGEEREGDCDRTRHLKNMWSWRRNREIKKEQRWNQILRSWFIVRTNREVK